MNFHEQVRQKIASFAKRNPGDVVDTTLLTDLVPESFALVELVIQLQEDFEVRLMQEDLRNVRTAGDLIDILSSKKYPKT